MPRFRVVLWYPSRGGVVVSQKLWNVRRVSGVVMLVCVTLVAATWTGILAVSGEPRSLEAALQGNKCILCNSYSPTQVPRICNSCNSKFSNKCILCKSYSPTQVPRICNSCNSKFSNKCILCNSYSPTQAPRICNSCNSKF